MQQQPISHCFQPTDKYGTISNPQQVELISSIIDSQKLDALNVALNTAPLNPHELLTLFYKTCYGPVNEGRINLMIKHECYTPAILGTFLVGEMSGNGWTEGSVAHKLLSNSEFKTKAQDAAYLIADKYVDRLKNGQQICETLSKQGVRNWRCESVVEY